MSTPPLRTEQLDRLRKVGRARSAATPFRHTAQALYDLTGGLSRARGLLTCLESEGVLNHIRTGAEPVWLQVRLVYNLRPGQASVIIISRPWTWI